MLFADRSTLVQVGTQADDDILSVPIFDPSELDGGLTLPSRVLDLARIDNQHVVVSAGVTIDIWKRSSTRGFIEMQCVRNCWKEATPIHLVVPRREDSACLIAGTQQHTIGVPLRQNACAFACENAVHARFYLGLACCRSSGWRELHPARWTVPETPNLPRDRDCHKHRMACG